MKPRSPEKSVGVADAKCWSSMRKWQRCTFLHSMWNSLSLLRNKLLLQGSRLKTVFFRAGHGNEDAPSGNGVLLYVLPGLAILFPVHLSFIILPTSRFEVYVLHPIAPFVFTEAVEPRTDARVFQLRPSLPCAVTGTRIHRVRLHRRLELCKGP